MTRLIPAIRALPPDIDAGIARCRLILSVLATGALLLDPTRPQLPGWLGPYHAVLGIHIVTVAVFAAHLFYSSILYVLARQHALPSRLVAASIWTDVLFATAIGFATEGVASPFFAFFTFAVVAIGFRTGFRCVVTVAAVNVTLYLSLIAASNPGQIDSWVMRAVYLAIIGYFVGCLGQERFRLEEERSELAVTKQRTQVARELHDGCVQTLSAVHLKLATCAELLRRGRSEDVLAELGMLRERIDVEHDSLRVYMQSLVPVAHGAAKRSGGDAAVIGDGTTRFAVACNVADSGPFIDEVLQIMREGIRNVQRHAHARSATVSVRPEGEEIIIRIDDDGVGLPDETGYPWTIASRVRELGGRLRLLNDGAPGTHLEITLTPSMRRASEVSATRESRRRTKHVLDAAAA